MAFIWEKEVEKIEENTVSFKDGTVEDFTDRQLQYIVTDEATDLSGMRALLLENAVGDFMTILEDHNIKKVDLEPILDGITASYNDAFLQAVGKAFGTYDEDKNPLVFQQNISLADINRVRNI